MTDTPTPALADGPAPALSTDKLEALLAAITPGPWVTEDTNSARLSMVAKSSIPGSNGCTVCVGQIAGPDKEANAEAIALVPDLIRQALADRARIEALEGALSKYKEDLCEGFCGEDGWSDAGHSHPECQRDCGGCLAAAMLLSATPTDGGSDAE